MATLAWNTRHHLETYYAAMGIGVVCHTLNPRQTAEHLAQIVNEAEDVVLAVAGSLLLLARQLDLVALAVLGATLACTYAAPVPMVHVANHVVRPGTDSIAIAVVAATHRRPTGLSAFPDGGAPRIEHEQGIFYLCVPDAPARRLRRIAVVPRPDSIRSGFTAWVSDWEGPERFVASLRGYTATESRPETHRMVWMAVQLDGTVIPLAEGRAMGGPATSLPRSCEDAAIADGTAWLATSSASRR